MKLGEISAISIYYIYSASVAMFLSIIFSVSSIYQIYIVENCQ